MSFVTFITSYGFTILSIIATIVTLVIAFIRAKKTGNTKGLLAIIEKIPSLVITAESLYGAGKGSAKLDYVLTQLRLYALQNNIKVDVEELTAQINSVVNSTNNVNINKINVETQPSEIDTTRGEHESFADVTQNNINI